MLLLSDQKPQPTILQGHQTGSSPAACRVIMPLSLFLTWLTQARGLDSLVQGRIVLLARRWLYNECCHHVSLKTDAEGAVVPLPDSTDRAALTFSPFMVADDVIYFAISMLEIELDYDVCCNREEFHTINGDDSAWEQAIKHIGSTLNDVNIGQFEKIKTRRPQLPDNWGDLQDHNSLPVVVWIKKIARRHLARFEKRSASFSNHDGSANRYQHTQTTCSNSAKSSGVVHLRAIYHHRNHHHLDSIRGICCD